MKHDSEAVPLIPPRSDDARELAIRSVPEGKVRGIPRTATGAGLREIRVSLPYVSILHGRGE